MKKVVSAMVFLLAVYGYLYSQAGEQVYIVGTDGNDAVYWLNGRRNVLPKTGDSAIGNAIAVSGSNVYIAGSDGDWNEGDAVYWLNGQRNVLPNGAGATAIAVSGSNVYITGYGIDEEKNISMEAVYWKNNQITVLPKERANINAIPRAITVTETNVYITGYEYDSGDNDETRYEAVYWINGQRNILPQNGRYANAEAIAVTN